MPCVQIYSVIFAPRCHDILYYLHSQLSVSRESKDDEAKIKQLGQNDHPAHYFWMWQISH